MIGAWVVAARKAPMPHHGEGLGIQRRAGPDRLHGVIDELSHARAHEERGREDTADGAGAERRGRRDELEDEDEEQRLPEQFAVQDAVHHAVAVAAHFRLPDGQRADDEPAEAQPQVGRQGELGKQPLAGPQQPQKPRRCQAGEQAEQKQRQDFPVRPQPHRGDLVERLFAEQLAHGERGDDRGENQRAEGFHGQRLEDDLRDEKRAADRGVVGRGDAGRRAAGHEQPQLQRRLFPPPADARRDHRGKLHQRAFAARSMRPRRWKTWPTRTSPGWSARRSCRRRGTMGLHVVRAALPGRPQRMPK